MQQTAEPDAKHVIKDQGFIVLGQFRRKENASGQVFNVSPFDIQRIGKREEVIAFKGLPFGHEQNDEFVLVLVLYLGHR